MTDNDADKKPKLFYLSVIEHPGGLTSTIKSGLLDSTSEKIEITTFFGDFCAYLESIPDNPESYEDYVETREQCPIAGLTVEQVMDPNSLFSMLSILYARQVVLDLFKLIESANDKKLPKDYFDHYKSHKEIRYALRLTFDTSTVDEPMKFQSTSVYDQFAVSYSKPIEFSLDMYEKVDERNCWYLYECNSITDLIVASMDYLLRKGYRIKRCDHCGKGFATKTLKSKYCQRLSPIKKYHRLKCEPAVRNARQDLERKHKYLYKRFDTAINPPMTMEQFLNESSNHRKTIRQQSSTLNLCLYQHFLEELQKSIRESNATKKTKR